MTVLVKRLRPYLGLIALTVMAMYVVVQWRDTSLAAVPIFGWRLIVALPFTILAVVCGGIGWSSLSGLPWSIGVNTFARSLPARYFPFGGIAQMAAQATLSTTHGVEPRRAVLAGPAFLVSLASGAVVVGIPAAFSKGFPPVGIWITLVGSVGVLVVLFTHYGLANWKRKAGGRIFKLAELLQTLPVPKAIGWGIVSVGLSGVSWAILLGGELNWFMAMSIFAIGWLIGFGAVFVPSGLGVRESALVVLLPTVAAPDVVASSLLLRLSVAISELLVIGVPMLVDFALSRRRAERST